MPPIKRAAPGLICLCALLCLTACSNGRLITRTELREVPRRQYVAVPTQLSTATPEPPKPAPQCTDAQTKVPVLCNRQLLDWLDAWRVALGLANADKAAIQTVSAKAVEKTQ